MVPFATLVKQSCSVFQMRERVNFRGMKAFGLDVTLSRICTLWQTPQEFSKTRSIRRNIPSQQAKLELLQSIKSTPWDPSGSKRETDAFILPLSKDEQQSQGSAKGGL